MRYLRHFKYYICRLLAKLNLLQHFSFHLTQKYSGHKFRIPVIKLDYKMFLIHEKTAQLEMINDIPVHGDMSRTNYLFIPSPQISMFDDLLISHSMSFS